jgi:uncharacterized protein (DUF1499 family)
MARWSAIIGLLAVAGLMLGPVLSGLHLLSPVEGMGLSTAGGVLGILGLLAGIAAGLRGNWQNALPGIALGALVALPSTGYALWARHFPPINDITTDTYSPPQFTHALSLIENHGRDFTYPGDSFAQRQREAYPEIQPLHLDMPPIEAFEMIEVAAEANPYWQVTMVDGEMLILEGVAITPLFRFSGDFIIQVRPAPGGSVVQMRSRSREGRGDLGVNAERIADFFAAIKPEAVPR